MSTSNRRGKGLYTILREANCIRADTKRVEMPPDYTPAVVPTPGQIASVVLQMITFGVLCICFSENIQHQSHHGDERCTARRTSWIKNYRTFPLAIWRRFNTFSTPGPQSNLHSCPLDLHGLDALRFRNLSHRTRLGHQLLTCCLRRRYPAMPSLLHDDQNPHLLFPGRARVHSSRIPEITAQDKVVGIQLSVHDPAIHGSRSHKLHLAHYVHQRRGRMHHRHAEDRHVATYHIRSRCERLSHTALRPTFAQ